MATRACLHTDGWLLLVFHLDSISCRSVTAALYSGDLEDLTYRLCFVCRCTPLRRPHRQCQIRRAHISDLIVSESTVLDHEGWLTVQVKQFPDIVVIFRQTVMVKSARYPENRQSLSRLEPRLSAG